uniref:Putative secreted protein n=1 Tax=Anopheles triannulatus TaxID=58253 RepID=A0A2M4B604_9DIPT
MVAWLCCHLAGCGYALEGVLVVLNSKVYRGQLASQPAIVWPRITAAGAAAAVALRKNFPFLKFRSTRSDRRTHSFFVLPKPDALSLLSVLRWNFPRRNNIQLCCWRRRRRRRVGWKQARGNVERER